MVEGLDGALDQLERLTDAARTAVQLLQDTQVGRAAMSGLDDVLSRMEDATAYYLPLPPTLRKYGVILGNCDHNSSKHIYLGILKLFSVLQSRNISDDEEHRVTELQRVVFIIV